MKRFNTETRSLRKKRAGPRADEREVEQQLSQPAVESLFQQATGLALLGREPLRCVVAEYVKPPAFAVWSNWDHPAEEPVSGTTLGLLPRRVHALPVEDNRIVVEADNHGQVLLSFQLEQLTDGVPGVEIQSHAEVHFYADADGVGGLDTLDALESLATAVWPAEVNFPVSEAEPYPRRGTGPAWHEPSWAGRWPGPADWSPFVTHPFQERFLRMPAAALLARAGETGRVTLAANVGRRFAADVAHHLRERLYLNHTVLSNRVVERIEPGGEEGDGGPELHGAAPLVLECLDVDTAQRYYDERFCLPGIDPARLFTLERTGEAACRLRFVGEAVPPRRLRLAYLRYLDWSTLDVHAGRTTFEVQRAACYRARTTIAPREDATPFRTQTRQAMLWLLKELGFGPETRWPSEADLLRLAERLAPAPLRAWMDGPPRPPVTWEARRRGQTALLTRVLRLRPQPGAPLDELTKYLDWLAEALRRKCAGLPMSVEWEGDDDA